MAIDLSKLSDTDLQALQANDLTKVSDDGLKYLQQNAGGQPDAGKPADLSADLGQSDDNMDALGAAGAGASEAMFNIPTYLAAAGDVISANAKGKTAKSWLDYKRARQEVNKQQEAAHPVAHALGGIGGALAMAPLLPELGVGEAVGGLLPEATGLVGKAATAAVKGAAEGAIPGAAYGLSGSEHGLDKPVELAKDVGSGALVGGLTGGALSGAASVGSSALEAAGNVGKESDYINKMKQMYKLGKEQNVTVSSQTGKDITAAMMETAPKEFQDKMMPVISNLGKNIDKAIQAAEENGSTVTLGDEVINAAKDISKKFLDVPELEALTDANSKRVMNLIFEGNPGQMTPTAARDLKNTFYDLAEKLNVNNPTPVQKMMRGQALDIGKVLNQNLKTSVPEYAKAADQFNEFLTLIPETIANKKLPIDLQTKSFTDMDADQVFKGIQDMLMKAQMPGANVSSGARSTLVKLRQNLDQLKMTNPQAYEAMGGDSAFKQLRDKANQLAGMQQAQGVSPHEGIVRSFTGSILGSGEGMGLNMANKLGRVAKTTGQSAPVQMGTRLFTAGNDVLQGLASKMQGSKATKFLGDALENALQNKTDVAKNAVLFRMLQDPAYRNILREEGLDEEFK